MQKKLQELTEKLYQEGVDKANEEAEKIISDAKKQAEEIKSKAEKDADKTIKDAEKQAEEIKKNSLNELQLAAKQSISDLKQRIAKLVEINAVDKELEKAFDDKEFSKNLILTVVKNWDPKNESQVDLKILLPEKQQKEFESFFKSKAKDVLDKGLEIDYSDNVKGGFKIGPKDGSYLISFADKDFDNFFKSFLSPRLIKMLYENNKNEEDKSKKKSESKDKKKS